MVNIPLFTRFYTSQVVQDFFHQHYHFRTGKLCFLLTCCKKKIAGHRWKSFDLMSIILKFPKKKTRFLSKWSSWSSISWWMVYHLSGWNFEHKHLPNIKIYLKMFAHWLQKLQTSTEKVSEKIVRNTMELHPVVLQFYTGIISSRETLWTLSLDASSEESVGKTTKM